MWSSLEVLFSSMARVQILRLFLLNPNRPFYQREIGRHTDQPIRAVQREMEKLASIGLLIRAVEGNRVFYCLNTQSPLLPELTALFRKAAGVAGVAEATRVPVEVTHRLPEPPAPGQPFPWMETPAPCVLPSQLRRRQTQHEWDSGY